MKEVEALKNAVLHIGHTGENEAVCASFSLLPFKEAFPGGAPALLVRRKGDAEAYPVTLTVEGDTAYWTVTSADTEKAGFGQCELQWYLGDMLAKSDKFDFLVAQALEAGAEPPDEPSKRWFEALEEKIGDLSELTTKAKENLVAAINEAARSGGASGGAGSIEMQVSGGYIQYSTDGGETWENLIAVEDLKGGKGEKGDTGATPDIRIGTVTTLPAGSDATASMSGTAENPMLNLEIPKGADGASGGGAGGSPSSALICDITLAEAAQAVSQTLEHNFYALHCIVNCGTSGVVLLVDADGTAKTGYINMLLDTVAQSDLSKLCGATYFGGKAWKTHLIHAIWSPDRTYFEQAMNATLENRTNAAVNQAFGGTGNMKGTIGPSAVSPDSGRTVNIVAPANTLLNAGVRVIIWGEYYE